VSSRRTLILVAAIVLGGVAAFAVYSYVGGIEDRANEGAERVEIYKIVRDIPKGTFGDEAFREGLIEQARIPRDFRPANAISDPAQIDGLVALSDLAANQVVVSNQFVSQAESLSTFSSLLRNNEVAVTVSVDEVRGVAGLLVPGDFVNVLVQETGSTTVTEDGEVVTQTAEGVYEAPARVLYQKVQILAVGQDRKLEPGETTNVAADGTEEEANAGLITFAVPADAAQRIASVEAGGGRFYLSLVPRDYQPEPLGPLDRNEELPGESGQQLTPYGPEGRLDS
jgi:pilus assembly protein CpaB